MDLFETRARQLEELQKARFDAAPNKTLFWTTEENAKLLLIMRLRRLSKTYTLIVPMSNADTP